MQKNALSILIQAPVSRVFDFTLDPKNTPKWIPSIASERAEEWPPRIGTVYRQRIKTARGTKPGAIVITGLVKNKQLDFHAVNETYTCAYRYHKAKTGTLLEYREENGIDNRLESPMKIKNLQMLKTLVEGNVGRAHKHK